MGMLDFFKPSKNAAVETGGLRDLYMTHLEQAALAGVKPMTYEQFIKYAQQQKQQTAPNGLMNLNQGK